MNELVYDMLDKIAENTIPNRVHTLLHVNCRTAFVETVVDLLNKERIKPAVTNVKVLALNWESLLYNKYSYLN